MKGDTEEGTVTLGGRKGKGQWLSAQVGGLYHFPVFEISERAESSGCMVAF